jgi:hypothetical protein
MDWKQVLALMKLHHNVEFASSALKWAYGYFAFHPQMESVGSIVHAHRDVWSSSVRLTGRSRRDLTPPQKKKSRKEKLWPKRQKTGGVGRGVDAYYRSSNFERNMLAVVCFR